MTYKRIEFSDHAVLQMQARGIRRREVRLVLAQGRSVPAHQASGGARRHAKRHMVGRGEVIVIYLEDAARVLVVTAMWAE